MLASRTLYLVVYDCMFTFSLNVMTKQLHHPDLHSGAREKAGMLCKSMYMTHTAPCMGCVLDMLVSAGLHTRQSSLRGI